MDQEESWLRVNQRKRELLPSVKRPRNIQLIKLNIRSVKLTIQHLRDLKQYNKVYHNYTTKYFVNWTLSVWSFRENGHHTPLSLESSLTEVRRDTYAQSPLGLTRLKYVSKTLRRRNQKRKDPIGERNRRDQRGHRKEIKEVLLTTIRKDTLKDNGSCWCCRRRWVSQFSVLYFKWGVDGDGGE